MEQEKDVKYLNDRINTLNNEVLFLRQLVNFQSTKIDKLVNVITEFMQSKQEHALVEQITGIQSHNLMDSEVGEQNLETPIANMDPQLQRVAEAAVGTANIPETNTSDIPNTDPSPTTSNTTSEPLKELEDQRSYSLKRHKPNDDGNKNHKVNVVFLHNPVTVKEIFDEFTKGFHGQIPLCEMDARFGKFNWRGDSRSKESKRYQRRKKLCDAIERGMKKYNKSADEIISYIEEFKGDRSLTWVMNGHLPEDLMA